DRARRESRIPRTSTSTRLPDSQDSQDFQEIQVRQDLHEVPECNQSNMLADSEETDFSDSFAKGDYSVIPEEKFLQMAWRASEGKCWQNDGVSETWEFCRYLRAHPRYESLAPAAVVRRLQQLIELDDSYLEAILAEISRVKFARGGGPLDWAIGMAA